MRVRSSDRMQVSGPGLNTPVATPVARVLTCWPCPPDSDEPTESTIIRSGSRSRNSCLSVALRAAPPVTSARRQERSWCPRRSSSEQRAREGVAHDQQGADLLALDRGQDVRGIEAFGLVLDHHAVAVVELREGRPVRGPVHEGRRRQAHVSARARALADLVERRVLRAVAAAAAERGHEHVGLAPQHPLRHARGPARVQDVEVVRAPRELGSLGARRGQRGLVLDRVLEQRLAGAVLDLEQHPELRQLGADLRQHRREGALVHDAAGAGVAQHVDQLFLDVTVVDVDGGDARLEGAEHALEVLRPVVQVEGQVVLAGLPVGELGSARARRPARAPSARSRAGACAP